MNNALQNHDCPPLMSDGQYVTDYRPSCDVHDLIIKQNNLPNSYEYRQFMIHNANNLMNINRQYYINKNQCNSCQFFQPDPNGSEVFWDKYTAWMGYKRSPSN